MNTRALCLCFGVIALCGTALAQPPAAGQQTPGQALRAEGDIPGAIAAFEARYKENPARPTEPPRPGRGPVHQPAARRLLQVPEPGREIEPRLEPLTDPDLVTARDDKRWTASKISWSPLYNAKSDAPIKDVAFAKALWRLTAWDQAFFLEVGIAARKTGMKSSVVEAVWKLKFLVQKQNQRDLEALLANRSWPRVGQVGQDAAMAAYLTVMHSNDGLQKKICP